VDDGNRRNRFIMSRIHRLYSWEALDSRGRPTVGCRVELDDGTTGRVIVPSGASTGAHEAVELRDGASRYAGRGVEAAVHNVRTVLADAVRGQDAAEPGAVDAALSAVDPSPKFATIGANAVLAVSLAAARAAAASDGVSLARHLAGPGPLRLPMPMVNIVSGGAHADGAIDLQDVLVIPVGAGTFREAVEWAAAVREATRRVAEEWGLDAVALVADEGGLGPALPSNRSALDLVLGGINAAGFAPGTDVAIALDVAATQFHRDGRYHLHRDGQVYTAASLLAEIARWCAEFPIISVEDPLAEDDWDGWVAATAALGPDVQLVGDDLFATDEHRLRRGVRLGAANAVLVKVNQNGLLSGAARVLRTARSAGYRTIVSARSGDTEDDWLADLAVGWDAGQIKVGSTHRAERTAKWNRLLELEATETTTFASGMSIEGVIR
jgi:enolase